MINGTWDSERDAALVDLRTRSLSFGQISARIGVTRNTALSRYQRVVLGRKYPDRRARKAQAEQKREKRANAILKFRHDLTAGVEQKIAILRALEAGAGGKLIAAELNVTKQRVYRLAAKAAPTKAKNEITAPAV